jgi:hypothetical protein
VSDCYELALYHCASVVVCCAAFFGWWLQPSLFGGDYEPVSLVRNLTITSSNYSTEGYKLLEVSCRSGG